MRIIESASAMEEVGGKAWQLFNMKSLGLPIPDFFVLQFDDIRELEDSSVLNKITNRSNLLNCEFFAVRSSATCEDSMLRSFAGVFETELYVTIDRIPDALKTVWNSVFNNRVKEYCETNHIGYNKISMRIIIQKQIMSRVSGVCFSRTSNNGDALIIESIYGLCDLLVSGKNRVTPDNVLVKRDSLEELDYARGHQEYVLGDPFSSSKNAIGKPTILGLPYRDVRKLQKNEVKEIAKTAIMIEKNLGFEAADIEWAYEDKKLYITQARPYTGYRIK